MQRRRSLLFLRSPLVIVALFVLLIPAITPRLNASDEVEFFAWLRSWAFDRDADFTNEYEHFYASGPLHHAGFHETFLERLNENGRPNNFTPIGAAVLWAPFFAAGHLAATLTGAPRDGYSAPYLAAIALGSAVYGLLALLLANAILRRVLGAGSPAPAIAVWLGTPLLFYMYVAPGFGHACSAFAVSLFIWTWLRVRDRWTLVGALQLGLTGALLPMVREQDAFFLAGPAADFARWVAVQVSSNRSAGGRATGQTLGRSLIVALGGMASFLLFYAPQLAAYQALNGHPGPAQVVARKMSWTSPHFFEVLLSPDHGFFFWTPLALLALGGLGWMAVAPYARNASLRPGHAADVHWIGWLCLMMFLLQAYVSGSVESWTVAGSFGQRRFVALTPLLTLGLAVFIRAFGRDAQRRPLMAALVILCIWWNIGLMAQFGLHIMDRQRLTLAANARVTFIELPRRLPALVWRYLFDRTSFFGLPPQESQSSDHPVFR